MTRPSWARRPVPTYCAHCGLQLYAFRAFDSVEVSWHHCQTIPRPKCDTPEPTKDAR